MSEDGRPSGGKQPLFKSPGLDYFTAMTASAVIEEIKALPPEEQSRVIQYALELARRRQLSGKELGDLAKRMVETKDPTEADRLQEDIVRGFYGNEPHA